MSTTPNDKQKQAQTELDAALVKKRYAEALLEQAEEEIKSAKQKMRKNKKLAL